MLDLHAYVPAGVRDDAIRLLDSTDGVRHATALPASSDGTVHIIADVEPSIAEEVMDGLQALGIPPGDIGLARRSWIQPAGADVAPESVLMWADVLGAARMESRVVGRYVGLMFVAGIIAGYGVIIDNPILIVGAMAVSPDLVPLIAASVGLVTGRWSLVRRGAATLIVGLGLAVVAAFGAVEVLELFGVLPSIDLDQGLMASFSAVGVGTIGVALAAGVAGVLAFESRAGAAVGVAISVTTIPASAYLGVSIGAAGSSESLGALVVLAVNVSLLIVAGSATLYVQRWLAARRSHD